MKQSKVTQYLAYAFGEVFLVVVGILIALGINNWNEGKKEKKVELEILTNIKTALVQDTLELKRVLRDYGNRDKLYNDYHKALKEMDQPNSPRVDRFGQMSLQVHFNPSTDPYKSLESRGFRLVKDKEVREAILALYNTAYPKIQDRINNFNQNMYDFRRPLLRIYFKINAEPIEFIPNDYDEVMNSTEIYNEMSIMKSNIINSVGVINSEVLPDVTSLIHLVGRYIDSHK